MLAAHLRVPTRLVNPFSALLSCTVQHGASFSTSLEGCTDTPIHSPIEVPKRLVHASLKDIEALLPFSWQIAIHRHRSMESRGVEVFYQARPGPVEPSLSAQHATTQPRHPSDSYLQLVYPFSTSAPLRDQYRRFSGSRLRWGLLLEDMDTLAGDIAGCHAGLYGGKVPATAYVDRFSCITDGSLGEQVTLDHDLRMDGQVTWVGRSSMEVLIALSSWLPTTSTTTQPTLNHQQRPMASSGWVYAGYARFVMAMRDSTATDSVPVPPLQPVTAQEQALFRQGEDHHKHRKQKRASHWRNKPPSELEVQLIHRLAVGRLSAGPTGVPIHATEMRTVALMHSQDRNHFNRIFGGHLMRLAFEHAFTVAAMHAKEWCDPVCMEDVMFIQPVPIGSVMQLRGKVVYTEGPYLRVLVEAIILQPGAADKQVMTNDFSFSFLCRGGPVHPVHPDTVVEALEYVLGQRQHQEQQQYAQKQQ